MATTAGQLKGYTLAESSPLGGVTELRIHGVGGTTPESMLFDPYPVRVAGDDTAGFYRTADAADGHHVEAYSWGGLTSHGQTRALWLLLLPFAVMNAAGWTQRDPVPTPGAGQGDPRRTPVGRLVLVLSLSLTALVAAGLTVLTTDVIAYQCGASKTCTGDRAWLAPLKPDQVAAFAGRRMALGLAATVAVILGLAFLAKRSRGRYEATPVPPFALDDATQPILFRASTWKGSERHLRLAKFHLAAAFATVGAIGAAAVADVAGDQHAGRGVAIAVAILASLVVVAIPVAVSLDRYDWARPLLYAGVAALVLAVEEALRLPRPGSTGVAVSQLAVERAPEIIFGIQVLILLVLAGVLLGQRQSGNDVARAQAFRWAAPLVLAALAIFMAGSVLAGLTVRVADLLGRPVAGAGAQTGAITPLSKGIVIGYPVSYDWAAFAFAATVLALVVTGAVFFVGKISRAARNAVDAVQSEYDQDGPDVDAGAAPPLPHTDPHQRGWAAGVQKARNVTDHLTDVDRIVSVPILAILGFIALSYPMFLLARGEYPAFTGKFHVLQTASTWLVALLPLGAVWVISNSWRTLSLRKTVANIWDLATYWPRWFCPFSPPCYAERAIPDIQNRLGRLIDEGGGAVLVSAHSQGTILTATALSMLPEDRLRRVSLVTYGSPIGRLYKWIFPAHWATFDPAGLAGQLAPTTGAAGTARWQHFWRKTDPIGHELFGPSPPSGIGSDTELRDTRSRRPPPGDPWPAPVGHSHYIEDPGMAAAVDKLVASLERLGPPGPSTGKLVP